MSGVNNFGVPDYARPNMDDFKKYFGEGNNPQETFKNEILSSLQQRFFPERDENTISPDDLDEPVMAENCPSCGHEYDEVDYEYQICHICHYQNNEHH